MPDDYTFLSALAAAIPYEPNAQQTELLAALSRFVLQPHDSADRVFILNGYAGTGKTSLIGALVKALEIVKRPIVLLAPTGRAAKVLSAFAGRRALTIHRQIYRYSITDASAVVGENNLSGAVFIVDEASMIGHSDTGHNLLGDLIQYVYSGVDCRLILIGDTAQLPPVGTDTSPAMSPEVLRSYGLKTTRATLTKTVRQAAHSGILYNATWLRRAMAKALSNAPGTSADVEASLPAPVITASPFDDVRCLEGEDLADEIAADYSRDGAESTIIITRNNARAVRYNIAVRTLINMSEEELVRGERLMVAKNSYHWTRNRTGTDFIANGDMAVVTAIHGTHTRYGLRFADVTLQLPDRDETLDCRIILDSLTTDHPALDPDAERRLRDGVLAEAAEGTMGLTQTECAKVLRQSPWANALRVKYAYAVTCHKAQGGQWRNVYVDLGYIPEQTPGLEFYRWLYTAVTRATSRLNIMAAAIEVR